MRKVIFTVLTLGSSALPLCAKGNIENLQKFDQHGVFMSMIAMSVVFLALVVLWICFTNLSHVLDTMSALWRHFHSIKNKVTPGKKANSGSTAAAMTVKDAATGQTIDPSDEVYAAIGMALFLAEDGMHDHESGVLTLNENPEARWTGVGNNLRPYPSRKF